MGRHGYTDDVSYVEAAMWRGRVKSATNGRRGQKFLRELRNALLAMPEKRLIASAVHLKDGDCCALGCLARVKGLDFSDVDFEDQEELNPELSAAFDIAECLVREVEYENDEGGWKETPEQRYERMLRWVDKRIKVEASDETSV